VAKKKRFFQMNLTGHIYAIVAVKRLTLPSALWKARHRFFGGETPVHVWGFGAFEIRLCLGFIPIGMLRA
jgi:hypothetical protein